jgi:hypothetical protein
VKRQQRDRCYQLHQRWMLLIHSKIGMLPIFEARKEVNRFIDDLRLLARGKEQLTAEQK